jgi:hypothetical protein
MSVDILKRYTSLSVLIDILVKKHLTLVDPNNWEDRNDVYYLDVYKEKQNLKTLLALCMTDAPETFHHWKIYAHGSCGVCIHFNESLLKEQFENKIGVTCRYVNYKYVKDVFEESPNISELPFIKRKAYEDELEFRIIYADKLEKIEFKNIDIDLKCITKIVVSPWMHKSLFKSVKELIGEIEGCSNIEMTRSAVVDFSQWKNAIKKLAE